MYRDEWKTKVLLQGSSYITREMQLVFQVESCQEAKVSKGSIKLFDDMSLDRFFEKKKIKIQGSTHLRAICRNPLLQRERHKKPHQLLFFFFYNTTKKYIHMNTAKFYSPSSSPEHRETQREKTKLCQIRSNNKHKHLCNIGQKQMNILRKRYSNL